MKRKTNKSKLVKEHLMKNGSINSWEAIEQYGETRLSSVIYNLRKNGYNIESEFIEFADRYGNKAKYVKYIMKNNVEVHENG